MGKKKEPLKEKPVSQLPPTFTVEGREDQLKALAYDLVEQRLRDGTATSQETTYFLKINRETDALKTKVLEKQAELLEAKARNLESQQKSEELYQAALEAFASYRSSDA